MRIARACLAALLLLAACAPTRLVEPADPLARLDFRMIDAGLEHIETYYVIEPVIPAIALNGLNRIREIDPGLTVSLAEGRLSLSQDGIERAALPLEGNSPQDWASAGAALLAKARQISGKVREAGSEKIYRAVFAGYTEKLDPYSRYAEASAARDIRAWRDGFGGVGITIAVEAEGARIVNVTHYTPAERAGLKRDDLILAVDGKPVAGLTQPEVIERVRGPVDSWVKLTIRRTGAGAPFTLSLQRALVVPESVRYRREGDIVYLHIIGVNAETTDSIKRKIENAKSEIGEENISGYILDLRGNPGGLVDEVAALANLFLEEGRIVSIEGRHPDSNDFFEAGPGDIAEGKPIVVLINGQSASAAEILAAALQDNGRAVIVGSNSFGKGSVQRIFAMPDEGELDLTWARFHGPSGYTLHGLGVLPSICTSSGAKAADLLAELREGTLPPLPLAERNRVKPEDEAGIAALRATCPAAATETAADLQVALGLLHEPLLYAAAAALAAPAGVQDAARTAAAP